MKLRVLHFLTMFVLSSCAGSEVDPIKVEPGVYRCPDPKVSSCADIYRPVCATRDNGVRCVTTPCDSTETATYPNDCAACADDQVYTFVEGECED